MKICVLNGSPKGKNSVTMQYITYWRQQIARQQVPDDKQHPQKEVQRHQFDIINIAHQGTKLEKNRSFFDETVARIKEADFIVWAFPLYFLLVHSNYMRFIELIFERGEENAFRGKPAVSLSTSIHFYDHTAHYYIRSICEDIGMNYIDFLPAHMHDLLEDKKRPSIDAIFRRWIREAELYVRAFPLNRPVTIAADHARFSYKPELPDTPVQSAAWKKSEKRVCIVADLEEERPNVQNMVDRMRRFFPHAEIIDLRTIKMGPCLGCLKCGLDNVCVYEGKDDFIDLYRNIVLQADILLFAGAIHHRYLSSMWQRYFERSFNKTHQPVLAGKQLAVLIDGPLTRNHNTREVLQAYAEVTRANLVDIVATDDVASCSASGTINRMAPRTATQPHEKESEANQDFASQVLDMRLDSLAETLAVYAERKVTKPFSFLGVAGMKIFRDEVFEQLKFLFQADHKYYKKHGIYDFPQKNLLKRIVMAILMLISKIPFVRKQIRERAKNQMVTPFRKVVGS